MDHMIQAKKDLILSQLADIKKEVERLEQSVQADQGQHVDTWVEGHIGKSVVKTSTLLAEWRTMHLYGKLLEQ